MPIYLLNSLGELDGGARDFDGPTTYLLFGIDVMAAVHALSHLTTAQARPLVFAAVHRLRERAA